MQLFVSSLCDIHTVNSKISFASENILIICGNFKMHYIHLVIYCLLVILGFINEQEVTERNSLSDVRCNLDADVYLFGVAGRGVARRKRELAEVARDDAKSIKETFSARHLGFRSRAHPIDSRPIGLALSGRSRATLGFALHRLPPDTSRQQPARNAAG